MLKNNYKSFVKSTLKLVEKKLNDVHPTRKEMVEWAKKYQRYIPRPLIFGEHEEGNPFEEGNPASWFQYLEFSINSCISVSCIKISSLPYRELIEIFQLDPVNDYIEEESTQEAETQVESNQNPEESELENY